MNEQRRKYLIGGVIALLLVCGALAAGYMWSQSSRGGLAAIQHLPNGAVVVTAANKGSTLERAGLEEGDLITAVNGEPVNQNQTFADMVQATQPGETIAITVQRGGETLIATSPVDSALLDFAANADSNAAMNAATLEASAQTAKKTLADLNVDANALNGDVTAKVNANLPSDGTITSVAGTNVDANHPLASLLVQLKPGATVALTVNSHGKPQTMPVTLNSDLLRLAAQVNAKSQLIALKAKLGLDVGDKVTAVGGVQVDANHSLASLIQAQKPGAIVDLNVNREGKSLDVTAKADAALLNLAAKVRLQTSTTLTGFAVSGDQGQGSDTNGETGVNAIGTAGVTTKPHRGLLDLNLGVDLDKLIK